MDKKERAKQIFNMITWRGAISNRMVQAHFNILETTTRQISTKPMFSWFESQIEAMQKAEAMRKTFDSIFEEQLSDFWAEYGDCELFINGYKLIIKYDESTDTFSGYLVDKE